MIPDKKVVMPDLQYKNLRFIATELKLLLEDLVPVIDNKSHTKFMDEVLKIKDALDKRTLFVIDSFYMDKSRVMACKLTPLFNQTLNHLSRLKMDIVSAISHILYIANNSHIKGGNSRKPWDTTTKEE